MLSHEHLRTCAESLLCDIRRMHRNVAHHGYNEADIARHDQLVEALLNVAHELSGVTGAMIQRKIDAILKARAEWLLSRFSKQSCVDC